MLARVMRMMPAQRLRASGKYVSVVKTDAARARMLRYDAYAIYGDITRARAEADGAI